MLFYQVLPFKIFENFTYFQELLKNISSLYLLYYIFLFDKSRD